MTPGRPHALGRIHNPKQGDTQEEFGHHRVPDLRPPTEGRGSCASPHRCWFSEGGRLALPRGRFVVGDDLLEPIPVGDASAFPFRTCAERLPEELRDGHALQGALKDELRTVPRSRCEIPGAFGFCLGRPTRTSNASGKRPNRAAGRQARRGGWGKDSTELMARLLQLPGLERFLGRGGRVEIRAQAPQAVWRAKGRSRFPFCSLRMGRGGEAGSPSPPEARSRPLGNLRRLEGHARVGPVDLNLKSRCRDPLG